MATENITDKSTLKSWFKRGLKPLETQFHAWMDSYWHKSEKIPTASVDGLEKILNSKAETSAINNLSESFNKHQEDDSRHKTEEEQGKLDHLPTNPNDTYATKREIESYEPVIFTATYTDNLELHHRNYNVEDDQKSKMADYFENDMKNPVILQTIDADNPDKYEYYIMTTQQKYGIQRYFYFYRIGSPVSSLMFNSIFTIRMRYMRRPNGSVTAFTVTSNTMIFDESEYKKDRYQFINMDFDMNNFTESGGITASIDTTLEESLRITGLNLPEGCTNITGYVLADATGCTQVVTDCILEKTMMRSKMWTNEWSPWKELGRSLPANAELVVISGTYSTVNGVRKYVLDTDQGNLFVNYFEENKDNPVVLKLVASDDTIPDAETYWLEKTEKDRTIYSMYFSGAEIGQIRKIKLFSQKLSSIDAWVNVTFQEYLYPLEVSEYKYRRYILSESFDMNNFIESGGITGFTEEASGEDSAVVGTNLPEGFTDFYGYILKNEGGGSIKSKCCTQVITDRILQKTMMRSSIPDDTYRKIVWLPWQEIGGNIPEVQLVTEYPTDLSDYQDGTIFIKQKAS